MHLMVLRAFRRAGITDRMGRSASKVLMHHLMVLRAFRRRGNPRPSDCWRWPVLMHLMALCAF